MCVMYALKFLLQKFFVCRLDGVAFFVPVTNGSPTERLQFPLVHIIHFSIARVYTRVRSFAVALHLLVNL